MRVLFVLLFLCPFLFGLVCCDVLFTRSRPPPGWTLGKRAPAGSEVNFLLALKQQNLAALEELFWAVSDPKSSVYQSFQATEEINALIAPHSSDVEHVKGWLLTHGIREHNIEPLGGDALEVRTSVRVAEKLFTTKLHIFTHTASGRSLIRQFGSYSVPESIANRIDFVSGLSTFPIAHQGYKRVDAASYSADLNVVPQTVFQLYNFSAEVPSGNGTGNSTSAPTTTPHPFNTTRTPFTTSSPATTGQPTSRGPSTTPFTTNTPNSTRSPTSGPSTTPFPTTSSRPFNFTTSRPMTSTTSRPFNFTTTPKPTNSSSNSTNSTHPLSSYGHALRMTDEIQWPITSQGVIEFESETFSQSDLQQFSQEVGIPISPVPSDQIIGSGSGFGQVEASLDIQFLAGVNSEGSNYFWLEAGSNWLYSFAVHFFNTSNVPQVISISYGWWEGDQCENFLGGECAALGVNSDAYVERVNTEFQKIGLRGISIIVSSGDAGAHTRTDEECQAPTLRVEFPASSPFVTSVGATQLVNAVPLETQPLLCRRATNALCAASGSEEAVSSFTAGFTSGGGFSEVSVQPSYQTAAVSAYLKSGVVLPPLSYYNPNNRGHPDVSAVGHNNLIVDNGAIFPVGGTSASAPIFAAIVAKLNQESVFQTGRPLGFLNPLLYQMAAEQPLAFNDIVTGDNICSEYGCFQNCQGYYAAPGWDPVTGLGTPNFGNMLAYITALNQNYSRTLMVL